MSAPERGSTNIEKVGNLYHRRIYPIATRITTCLTNHDQPLTDFAILPFIYLREILVGTGLLWYLKTQYDAINPSTTTGRDSGLSTALYTLGGAGASATVFLLSYGGNLFRTSIDKKMGIKPNLEMNPKEELHHVIEQMNHLGNVPPINNSDLPRYTNAALDDFLVRNEGYSVTTSARVKHSRFSRLMYSNHAITGLMNPFLHEIVLFTKLYPEAIAHEQAHLKGITQERLAQFVGIAAQIESNQPYLQFLGYREWLRHLSKLQAGEWGISKSESETLALRKIGDALLARGLDTTIVEGIISQAEALAEEAIIPSSYSLYLRNFIDFTLSKMSSKTRSVRQKIITNAYTVKPLQLLSAYRQQGGTI